MSAAVCRRMKLLGKTCSRGSASGRCRSAYALQSMVPESWNSGYDSRRVHHRDGSGKRRAAVGRGQSRRGAGAPGEPSEALAWRRLRGAAGRGGSGDLAGAERKRALRRSHQPLWRAKRRHPRVPRAAGDSGAPCDFGGGAPCLTGDALTGALQRLSSGVLRRQRDGI